jgi:serine/threonine protein kinase
MPRTWNDLEGVSLAGRYVLGQCLSTTEGDAWYQTKLADGASAAIRLMPENGERLALWREAVAVDHPNLVRIFDAGRTQLDAGPLIYAVGEFPDDFLAGVLQERPLSPTEARDVLRAVLGGLKYLHGRGLVHGSVDPAHIMAFGDQIKLQSDTWELPVNTGGPRRVGPYDAPERARGTTGPESDIWSLAITLHEILTQQRPNLDHDGEFRYMGEPFATVLRRSLVRAPEARWTVQDIDRHVYPNGDTSAAAPAASTGKPAAAEQKPAVEPKPAGEPKPVVAPKPVLAAKPVTPERTEKPSVRPVLPPPRPREESPTLSGIPFRTRSMPLWWVPVAGLVAAVGLGFIFLRQPQPSQSAPPPQPAATVRENVPASPAPQARVVQPPAPVTTKKKSDKPSPLSQSASREDQRWRVIAFTYAQRSAAEKKAVELNKKHPGFRAEVFTPASEHGPYLISLGGRLSRSEALDLQKRAREGGLPRDTFVRNFVR